MVPYFTQVGDVGYVCKFEYSDGHSLYVPALHNPKSNNTQIVCQVKMNQVCLRAHTILLKDF